MTATERWATALHEWAIPPEILSGAPESPWGFSLDVFVDGARRALAGDPTPTHRCIADALPDGGVLLDVGSGAGAASLPVVPPGGCLVAVDEDPRMLRALEDLAERDVRVLPVEGRWPDVADQAGVADVAVCANVAYNVADIGPFISALTAAARKRVVVELTSVHPQTALTPLWSHFWGLSRPSGPTAEDARRVVGEVVGMAPESESWTRAHPLLGERDRGTVASMRRRLCLPETADGEVAEMLDRLPGLAPLDMVTLWWEGAGLPSASGLP